LDSSGKKIVSRELSGVSEQFDLENHPKGIYLVKSKIGKYEKTQKLIIN
jgi:hypothetical protein